MSTDNTDTQNDIGNTLNDATSQQSGDTGLQQAQSDWLDGQLDALEKETGNDRKATDDQNQAGKSTQQGQQRGNESSDQRTQQNGRQGNDTQQRGQVTSENQRFQQTPPQTRTYGTNFRTNERGDIVDLNGAVVARSGGERAIFHKLFPMIDRATREASEMKTRIEHFEAANQVAKNAGLSIDEQTAGLAFMASWKKDAKQAIKTMLNLANERGIDTSDIVQGGGGFDQAAMRGMMSELFTEHLKQFAPILANFTRQEEMQQVNDEVSQQYAAFIEQFPDAVVHEESIANVMRDKGVSEREAYFIVRTFAAENGFDWKKPLRQQLEARQSGTQQGGGQQQRPSGGGNNRERPLPHMQGRSTGTDEAPANRSAFADPDDSWEKIAREVLREHGRPV